MEKAYDKLLELYKTNMSQYESERLKVKELVKHEKALFKYDELVPYPDYDDPNFNKTIFYKKEFNRNKSILNNNNCVTNDFELSNNQKFIKNFMSPFTHYNGILLFHGVGVGKTCTAISIAERYFEVYQKKVLVVLSSNIKDNFKKQIFDINKYDIENNRSYLCTGTTYTDMIINKKILKKEEVEKKINKIIAERYQFIGYKELANMIDKLEENIINSELNPAKHEILFKQKVDELFSDRLIIIDEAHNLRVPADNGSKQISVAFMNLLKMTKNVKLVLMTATPMYDDANEILSMLNLLMLNDKRAPIEGSDIFDKNGNLTVKGKENLIEKCRGYVSFMRGQNPYIFPARLYPDVNGDNNVITEFPTKEFNGDVIPVSQRLKKLKLIGSSMSKYQKQIYSILQHDASNSNSDADELDDNNKDMQNTTQIANLAYPTMLDIKEFTATQEFEQLYGKKGFEKCFDKQPSKSYKLAYNKDIKDEFGEFLSYKMIGDYAPKIKRILDYVSNSNGIVFIHSQYYYSGIIPIALALEHIGFTKYNSENLGHNITIDNKFKGKRPSYIILSKNRDISPNNDAEIAAIKAKGNSNGENIKVVIVSKIGTEGIDFKRIREVHILEPWFNMSRIEQIIGRAVRTCSHMDLSPEERNVTIFLHACKYDQEKESIDLRMYRIAENKEIRVKAVEKVLQENAIDCNLNKDVLSFPKDKVNITLDMKTSQGETVKNYRLGDESKDTIHCNPRLDTNSDASIDQSTFHRVFIIDDVTIYKKYISALFQRNKSYTFESIYKALKESYNIIESEILSYALDEMIADKYKIYDSQNRQGFLIYRADLYIFQYSDISDMRLTLDEREEMVTNPVRTRLDISEIGKRRIEDDRKPPAKPKLKVRRVVENIIKVIVDRVTTLADTYRPLFGDRELFMKVTYDYVVDRLNPEEFMNCIEHISSKVNNEEDITDEERYIFKSLVTNNLLLFDDDDKIIYIYNHFENDLFCLREDGKFTKCSALDINKMKDKYNKIIQAKKKAREPTAETQALLVLKDKDIKFKIKDANSKTKGSVCTTSIIKSLSDRVKSIDTGIHQKIEEINKGKGSGSGSGSGSGKIANTKFGLCEVIEILMRLKGNSTFLRSM